MVKWFSQSFIPILIVFFILPSWSYIPPQTEYKYYGNDFYSELENGLSDKELKKTLNVILKSFHKPQQNQPDEIKSRCDDQDCYQHVIFSYTTARKYMFGQLHLEKYRGDYRIKDVYCDKYIYQDDLIDSRPMGPHMIPDPKVFSAEHTWPQSRFSTKYSDYQQKADLHILFPVNTRINTSRSNLEFGEIIEELDTPCPASRRGYIEEDDETHFEPPNSHKGNVARALFYFSVRYEIKITETEETYLKKWHLEDPVDQEEFSRNEEIFKIQKVRNPFIDHPWLVDAISDF